MVLLLALHLQSASSAEIPQLVKFAEPTISHFDFNLIDARPDIERTSFVKKEDDDTVIRLGDDAVTPNLVSLLQRELQAQLGSKLAGRSVVATSVTVSFWMATPASSTVAPGNTYIPNRPGASALGSALAIPLIAAIESLRDRKAVGKSIVVNVEGEVDEMGFSANVYKKQSWSSSLNEGAIRDAISEAMRKAATDAGRWLQYRYAQTLPKDYVGPRAKIRDSAVTDYGPHLQQFFYLSKINDQPVNNSFDVSQRRTQDIGHFEPLNPREREVPAGKIKVEIVGRAGRGSNPKFDDGARGAVEFVAEAGKSYEIRGEASDENESVWIAEQGSGAMVGEMFRRKR